MTRTGKLPSAFGGEGAELLTPARQPHERHRQVILSAHERSLAFGLQPMGTHQGVTLSGDALREHQQRHARLCLQAVPLMDLLLPQFIQGQTVAVLADAGGTILHTLGDPGLQERVSRAGLHPGARWAEADRGTNAIGTTLMVESPTLVHGQEHFQRALQFLTASGAPIFDHRGGVLGVVALVAERRSYHPHSLALALSMALLIEQQSFADLFRQCTLLHLHPNPLALGSLQSGILALGESGQILGLNRQALLLLGGSASQLRRESLLSLFGRSFEQLVADSQSTDGPLLIQMPLRTEGPSVPDRLHLQLQLTQALRSGHTPYPAPLLQDLNLSDIGLGWPTLVPRSARTELPASAEAAASLSRMSGWRGAPPSMPYAAAALRSGPEAPRFAPNDADPTNFRATPEIARMSAGMAQPLRETEAQAIRAAVRAAGGNLSLAARQLGIGRSTLYRKLKQDVDH